MPGPCSIVKSSPEPSCSKVDEKVHCNFSQSQEATEVRWTKRKCQRGMTDESIKSRHQTHIHTDAFLSFMSALSTGVINSELCSASGPASLCCLDIQSVHSTVEKSYLSPLSTQPVVQALTNWFCISTSVIAINK